MKISNLQILSFYLLIILLNLSCTISKEKPKNKDSFKALNYAVNFSFKKKKGNIELKVYNSWAGEKQKNEYYLLTSTKDSISSKTNFDEIISIPVKKVICMSATQVAQIVEINEEESIIAVSGANYIYNQKVRKKIKAGKIKDIAFGQNLNFEALLNLRPDIIFMYGVNTQDMINAHKLRKLGLHVVFNNDYLENTPLGRAQWTIFTAAFFNKIDKAETSFQNEVNDYQALIRHNFRNRSIFLNIPFKDTWYMPGGNSYFAKLLKDAGAHYIFESNKQNNSISLDFEAVFKVAQNCDIWLNAGSMQNLQQLKSVDTRMKYFKAFKNQQVYNPIKRLLPGGANDFWETGVTHPHLLLSDIQKIVNQSTDTVYYFYKRLQE